MEIRRAWDSRRKIFNAAGLGFFMLTVGLVCVYLTLCSAGARPETFMGYSTGKELFDGLCRHKANLIDCVDCCSSHSPNLTEECVDLCLQNFTPQEAFKAMAGAAARVRARDTTDAKQFSKDVKLIQLAQHSRNERVRNVAVGMARETGFSGAVRP